MFSCSQDRSIGYELAEKLCPDGEAAAEISALLRWLDIKCVKLLDRHWKAVEALAKRLLKEKTLSGREARETIRKASPYAYSERPMYKTEREQAERQIAGLLLSLDEEIIKNETAQIPPNERRLWQKVQRDIKAGLYVLKPSK